MKKYEKDYKKKMKNKIKIKSKIIVLLLLAVSSIQAQTTENELWTSFQTELAKIIQIQSKNEFIISSEDYKRYDQKEFMDLLINTPIEQKGITYLAENYGKDSLVLVRKFIYSVFQEIATNSMDSLSRQKAINYLFDYSFNPSIRRFFLIDFNEEAKQQIVKIISRQYAEEEVDFYAATQARYEMMKSKNWYDDYYIPNYIKEQTQKYKKKVSYGEAWEVFYQTTLSKYKEKLIKFPVTDDDWRYLKYMILNAGLLNIHEVIPYLKEYANSDKYDDETRMYAVCALAAMRVEDYEERTVVYFDIDIGGNTWLAEMINSQKIWYTYMRGLKSEKYYGNCPVAYRIISGLSGFLKDFPKTDRPYIEEWIEFEDGVKMPILSKQTPVPLVPYECYDAEYSEKVPINPDHVKVAVDWMEANKGKYELQRKIDRTF